MIDYVSVAAILGLTGCFFLGYRIAAHREHKKRVADIKEIGKLYGEIYDLKKEASERSRLITELTRRLNETMKQLIAREEEGRHE